MVEKLASEDAYDLVIVLVPKNHVSEVLLAPVQELDATRADNPAGMTLVGLATLVFLVWLWRRVARRNKEMKR